MGVGPLSRDIQLALRELAGGLGRLNGAVASQAQLRTDDLELLDVITRRGPITPSELAAQTGFHPATLTGVIDRLERGGWLARRRDPADRRKIVLEALPNRVADIVRLYGPMTRSVAALCSEYSPDELAVIHDFLRRTAAAGDAAVESARKPPSA
jgi:DNA-binding MarR family transcriptional regulator